MSDYTVIAGELDEPGRETADVAFLPGFIDGYTNVGRPYWGWPEGCGVGGSNGKEA